MLSQDGVDLEWCDTSVQLADALTKLEAERGYLTTAMHDGYVSVKVSAEAASAKEAIRAARHRRANERRALDAQSRTSTRVSDGMQQATFMCESGSPTSFRGASAPLPPRSVSRTLA
jgi:hypothetical protein